MLETSFNRNLGYSYKLKRFLVEIGEYNYGDDWESLLQKEVIFTEVTGTSLCVVTRL